jgi:hypothetical protein
LSRQQVTSFIAERLWLSRRPHLARIRHDAPASTAVSRRHSCSIVTGSTLLMTSDFVRVHIRDPETATHRQTVYERMFHETSA